MARCAASTQTSSEISAISCGIDDPSIDKRMWPWSRFHRLGGAARAFLRRGHRARFIDVGPSALADIGVDIGICFARALIRHSEILL
jgi:hypothetical protein